MLSLTLSHPGVEQLVSSVPRAVGWERNLSQKLAPRVINLSQNSPRNLARASVDLNLRLMRWRALPELKIDGLSQAKCLLLGAGTLGCAVARLLMAWGVKQIDFVDSGVVSHSNPVRQSLYSFEDAAKREPKAAAAAKSLKLIYPHVISEGHCLTIPMPGHILTDATRKQVETDLAALTRLIEAHDVIFLLTDTRESRWLPTLIGRVNHKLVINSALGFDSFVVMRHGEENDLGCYFCNDVVAPTDSSKDRTLDQQCTVTRPGLAYTAAANAVELFVNVWQSDEKQRAVCDQSVGGLGEIPHTIRGWIGQFTTMKLKGTAFKHCTACSPPILQAYEKDRDKFVLKVLAEGVQLLEQMSGLTAMKQEAEKMMEDQEDWAVDDEEDDDM